MKNNGLGPGRGIVALLAILVIVLALVSLLFNNFRFSPKTASQDLTKYEEMEDSDEVGDIEQDLNETELEDADSEVVQIESELNASLED